MSVLSANSTWQDAELLDIAKTDALEWGVSLERLISPHDPEIVYDEAWGCKALAGIK